MKNIYLFIFPVTLLSLIPSSSCFGGIVSLLQGNFKMRKYKWELDTQYLMPSNDLGLMWRRTSKNIGKPLNDIFLLKGAKEARHCYRKWFRHSLEKMRSNKDRMELP